MCGFQLAPINIASLKESLDSPSMADFVANLGRINALAEQAPGFVWRLKDESGDATAIRPFGENMLVNKSVWGDVAAGRRPCIREGTDGQRRHSLGRALPGVPDGHVERAWAAQGRSALS